MVDEETQTSPSEKSEKYSRDKEPNETRNLSTKELKRLVLLEQLSLIRIQKAKFLSVNLLNVNL